MGRSSIAVAVCAVAATVSAAFAVVPPSARAGAFESLYANGSEVASPRLGGLSFHQHPGSRRVLARAGRRTIFGSPTRLAVVGASGDWLAVISPALGNRVRGYVHRSKVRLVHDPYSLEVDRSARRLTVWRMGIRLRDVALAIGTPATPTPLGRFSVTDKLSNFWPSLYGCCVLVLSGRQTKLPADWSGGDRLAIHAGSGIGSAVSSGCLRARPADMGYLLTRLPLGTQVVIHD
jgi:lipoprotein-anchoring transpeptidase ErfK/SrfK